MKNVEANGVGNNNQKAIARPTITSTSNDIITHNNPEINPSSVNNQYGEIKKSKDDTIDADYLSAVERGDMGIALMTI